MSENAIRVLRHGKNTQTGHRFEDGAPGHKLLRAGAGQYLPGEYSDISAAGAFAEGELKRDPSAILYIVRGDQILDIVMDQDFHRQKSRRDSRVYAAVSTAGVFVAALCVSLFIMPFTSTHAHAVFTGGMTLLYAGLLAVFGTRNIHALMLIGIILVMMIFLTPSIKELLEPDKVPQTATREAAPSPR
jgi:hypothetical protein